MIQYHVLYTVHGIICAKAHIRSVFLLWWWWCGAVEGWLTHSLGLFKRASHWHPSNCCIVFMYQVDQDYFEGERLNKVTVKSSMPWAVIDYPQNDMRPFKWLMSCMLLFIIVGTSHTFPLFQFTQVVQVSTHGICMKLLTWWVVNFQNCSLLTGCQSTGGTSSRQITNPGSGAKCWRKTMCFLHL